MLKLIKQELKNIKSPLYRNSIYISASSMTTVIPDFARGPNYIDKEERCLHNKMHEQLWFIPVLGEAHPKDDNKSKYKTQDFNKESFLLIFAKPVLG